MVNDQDFPKLTGGTRQRGIGQRRIRYYYLISTLLQSTQKSKMDFIQMQEQHLRANRERNRKCHSILCDSKCKVKGCNSVIKIRAKITNSISN